MKIYQASNKPIVLKKGTNRYMMIGSIIALITIVMIFTSKMWLPDDRTVITRNINNEILFNRQTVKMDDGYYIDKSKKIGEISLTVKQPVTVSDDITVSVYQDGKYKYPKNNYKVIKGSLLPMDANAENMFQEIIIQFAIPDDFYYLSFVVTQEKNKSETIDIDYRLWKTKELSEKDNNYLKLLDDLNLKIVTQEQVVTSLKDAVSGYDTTYKQLKNEVKAYEAQLSIVTDENAKVSKQKVLDLKVTDRDNAKKALKEKRDLLKTESKKLKELKDEKAKQK